MAATTDSPLLALPGVNAMRAKMLHKLGLERCDDVYHYLPRRHEDRTTQVNLTEAEGGMRVCFVGKIHEARTVRWKRRRGSVFEVKVVPAGFSSPEEILHCRWFHAYGLPKVLTKGRRVVLFGMLAKGKAGWSMVHPEHELLDDGDSDDGEEEVGPGIHHGRLTPVYPLVDGVTQRAVRECFFDIIRGGIPLESPVPAPTDMPPFAEALRAAHFPDNREQLKAAKRRLAFDEFFVLRCALEQRRAAQQQIQKSRAGFSTDLAREYLRRLAFNPTGAQRRVMREIEGDLATPTPMNRLLQGDVGSGKTMVAVYAMLVAVGQKQQAALMAPTEILAEQHYLNLRRWLDPLGVRVGLYTGSKRINLPRAEGELNLGDLAGGDAGSVIVGTHALLYDTYQAERLGLVVIDEQHKFGVLQRRALAEKGANPDVLVMTATPIPRTLGMTLYGDLDVSVIDQLPPGRRPIITHRAESKKLEGVWRFVGREIEQGRQAYIIYPLVDESDKVEAKAVTAEHASIAKRFPDLSVALLHGRMKPDEKDRTMREFRGGEHHILVSTSVIEVGVDVPNASVMVIENAERFGLAALHQLRGRIGRGKHDSYCVLVGQAKSADAWRRLKIMEETNDGFRIAEEDLRIRGAGNIFSTEQSGLPPLRHADLLADSELLERARNEAAQLFKKDPDLNKHPGLQKALVQIKRGVGLATVS